MKLRTTTLLMTAALAAAPALAGPRDTANFVNQNSEAASLAHPLVLQALNVANYYPVKYLVLNGQWTKLSSATCESEAVIKVHAPNGMVAATISPFQDCSGSGTLTLTNYIVKLPQAVANSQGEWGFAFTETYDDIGTDSRWDTISITLDDGPPSWLLSQDVGAVRSPGFTLQNQTVGASNVRWFKMTLPVPAANLGFFGTTYLDIDTEGSAHADMELAVYSEDGRLVASNDDGGSGNQARLTFGASAPRPAIGSGSPYDNSDGTLDAATYYIAVSAFNATFGPTSWNATSAHTSVENFSLNVRTNIDFSPFCRGDHNKNCSASVQDIFDFLNDWFAGCP